MSVDQTKEIELAQNALVDCVAALQRARHELDRYYRLCDLRFAGAHNDMGVEARKRLTQMLWFLEQIETHQDTAFEAQRMQIALGAQRFSGQITSEEWAERMTSPEMTEALRPMSKAMEAIENLTEAFYWIAFRARTTIRALPDMGAFEGKGVRDTRNKLLEHAEKGDSGVMTTSFGFGHRQGPVIKAVRYTHQTDIWPDRGLFANAMEFATELIRRLEKSCKELDIS